MTFYFTPRRRELGAYLVGFRMRRWALIVCRHDAWVYLLVIMVGCGYRVLSPGLWLYTMRGTPYRLFVRGYP